MFQVKQVEMMTNPPSYTLLNVRAGKSQGILTVKGRLDLNIEQLYSSAMLQAGLVWQDCWESFNIILGNKLFVGQSICTRDCSNRDPWMKVIFGI